MLLTANTFLKKLKQLMNSGRNGKMFHSVPVITLSEVMSTAVKIMYINSLKQKKMENKNYSKIICFGRLQINCHITSLLSFHCQRGKVFIFLGVCLAY